MRTLAISISLALAACTSAPVLNSEPATTPKGEPDGAAVTATIGAAGGTLASGDGKLALVVPAGALMADVTFSVTPLTVEAPGGLRAYRLGPEGTTFSTPASLRFTASEADLAGSEAAALRIAYQDTQGRWRAFEDGVLDGQTLTVKTTHLSDWSALVGWQLRPAKANVALGATQALSVRYCHTVTFNEGSETELVSLMADCQDDGAELAPLLGAWAVNGVTNGSAEVGTIAPGSPSATYTAPGSEPSSNPVAVSVEFSPPVKGGKKTMLVSNLTIGSALPPRYAGSFTYHSRVGASGTGQYLEVRGTGAVTFDRHAPWGADAYKMSGTFTLQSLATEMGDCACVASSGSGSLADTDNSLKVRTDGRVVFGFSTTFNTALTCTKRTASASCSDVASYPVSVQGSVPLSLECGGTLENGWTTLSSLTGSMSDDCPQFSRLEEFDWSFSSVE